MELIYVHIPEYRGFRDARINFKQNIRIQYDLKEKRYHCIEHKSMLPDDFWGDNITNLTMIVGNNGAGKTSLMQFIIEMYCDMLYPNKMSSVKGLMIYKENENYLYYASERYNEPVILEEKEEQRWKRSEADHSKGKLYRIDKKNAEAIFSQTKLIFKTGILTYEDCQRNVNRTYRKNDFFYDCSVGGLFQEDAKNDVNADMRELRNLEANSPYFESYFTYEQYKQVKFVFDKNQYNILQVMKDEGFPVPVPERLYMGLLFDDSISDELQFDELPIDDILFDYEEDSICWQSRTGKFLFTNEKIWDDNKEISEILPLVLAKGAVQNALKSFFHLLRFKTKKITLFEKLKIWDHDDLDIKKVFPEFINWLWENVAEIINKAQDSAYDSRINLLLDWKAHYLEFLDFVLNQDISIHFQCEDAEKWIRWEDIGSLRFSAETSDSEWFIDFLHKYRYICDPYYFLDFSWGLSSGEYNLLSMFSSFYYIFTEDYTNEKHGMYKIKNQLDSGDEVCCDSVIIMIDEADLTYHPQWQTEFIAILTRFLTKVYPPECCKSIQLLISTHSPILLGDMPSDHVVYLKYDSKKKCTEVDMDVHSDTFGQNIYLLFKDSFFLNQGTMGRFAKDKITELFNKLEKIEKRDESTAEILDGDLSAELKRCENFAVLIAEPIIRNKLMRQIARIGETINNKDESYIRLEKMSDVELDTRIKLLQKERERRLND